MMSKHNIIIIHQVYTADKDEVDEVDYNRSLDTDKVDEVDYYRSLSLHV